MKTPKNNKRTNQITIIMLLVHLIITIANSNCERLRLLATKTQGEKTIITRKNVRIIKAIDAIAFVVFMISSFMFVGIVI